MTEPETEREPEPVDVWECWSQVVRPAGANFSHPLGDVAVRIASSPERPPGRPGEDAAGVFSCEAGVLVLAVADGMGGQRGGARASKMAVEALGERVREDASVSGIVGAFDDAQAKTVRRRGAGATTMVAARVTAKGLRLFNVGDSEAMLINSRRRIKVRTTVQSPVGYLTAAGAITPDEAVVHDYRHLLSSAIGIDAMRLEVCGEAEIGRRDTLVLGSDGLFDNMFEEDLMAALRGRDLGKVADRLADRVSERMAGYGPPSKADDMSFILYRPHAKAKKKTKKTNV